MARLYADIRHVTDEPGVNLIYRHLATIPGALPWVWQRLRPAFLSSEFADAAERVRDAGRDVLEVVCERQIPAPGAPKDAFVDVLSFYIRSNPRNMVAIAILGSELARAQIGEATTDADWLPLSPSKQTARPPLVPMRAPQELTGPTGDRVRAIQHILSGNDGPVPSVLRHLANWPHVIAVWHEAITPAAADGRLDRCAGAMAACALRAGQAPSGAGREAIRSLLIPAASRDAISKALSTFQPFIPRVTAGLLVLETVIGRTK